ncbi:MAG: hypothetical protein QXL94_00345 [Candidatus Parvarchaeum sp.]
MSTPVSYSTPAQYLILVAPSGADYLNQMILINNMTNKELASVAETNESIVEWLSKYTGMKESDYYFIGHGNYMQTPQGLVEGSWDFYYSVGKGEALMKENLTTQDMEQRIADILDTAIEHPDRGEAPFIFKIYLVKNKPVKMPNIKATYGNPYLVYAVDFSSIRTS